MNISPVYILVSIIALAAVALLGFAIYKRGRGGSVNTTLFGIGLLIVGGAGVLLLMDVIESGAAAAIGFLGIGLIAISGRSNMRSIR